MIVPCNSGFWSSFSATRTRKTGGDRPNKRPFRTRGGVEVEVSRPWISEMEWWIGSEKSTWFLWGTLCTSMYYIDLYCWYLCRTMSMILHSYIYFRRSVRSVVFCLGWSSSMFRLMDHVRSQHLTFGQDEKLEVEVCDLKKIFCRYVKGSNHWGHFLHVETTGSLFFSADGRTESQRFRFVVWTYLRWKVMKSENEFCKWWNHVISPDLNTSTI